MNCKYRVTSIRNRRRALAGLVVAFVIGSLAPALIAQTSTAGGLTGRITDASGALAANVTVTATSLTTGQTQTATTAADGTYKLDLPPGNYRVKLEAAGFKTREISSVTISGAQPWILDSTLETGEATNGPAATTAPEQLPNAPSSTTNEPSLSDLGFPAEVTKSDPKQQALLDKRTHMLKIHQRMGLITAAPLIATLLTSVNAGGHNSSSTSRDVHLALGAVTGDLYGITAYYALRAPKPPGTVSKGPIRFHKAMAWIHGPGMILTPILGALAYDQRSNGQKVTGIASAHGPVAVITAGAFGAALLSMTIKF
ncbi:MAG: carboxypeptidase-like regulatory domain-containing protein [Terriglobales bacterium]|jgi:hypothetical protein